MTLFEVNLYAEGKKLYISGASIYDALQKLIDGSYNLSSGFEIIPKGEFVE